MWKMGLLLMLLPAFGCGYKIVGWSTEGYQTIEIRPVQVTTETRPLRARMQDALIERCLAGSGYRPVDSDGDLRLSTRLIQYSEQVIATGADGRTERVQFNLTASFELIDRAGQAIWSLNNYRYSDQYAITTGQGAYRDEVVSVQDEAMRTIADLVITNINLAISEFEQADE